MVVTTALDTDTTINALPNLSQKKFDYSEQQTKFTLMSQLLVVFWLQH